MNALFINVRALRRHLISFSAFCIAVAFSGCATSAGVAPTPIVAPAPKTLKVALYPYVPRPDQFKTEVLAAWKKAEPNVGLQFVEWDCYSADPTEDLDVFVFDAIFLDYFATKFLSQLRDTEVGQISDFLPYALNGSRVAGTLYGIPQLGCANMLFYRKADGLAAAKTLGDVVKAMGECTYSGQHAPAGVGLLVDLSGSTTAACLYLDAMQDVFGTYTPSPPLPPDDSKVDPWAIQNLWRVLRMSNKDHASYEDPGYERAAWFGKGEGRAYVGFTESMSNMGDATRAAIDFKPMPLADTPGVSLFFADIIGVNATAEKRGTRDLALKLANLMASKEVMVASIGPTSANAVPQYLMPVRTSIFQALEPRFPLYRRMHEVVSQSDPRLFRISKDSKPWLAAMKKQIRTRIFAAPDCEPKVP